MATFLELCRDVARESGTFPNFEHISSVENRTGRELRLVHWVRDAWDTIQRDAEWTFLEASFEGQLNGDQRDYMAQGLGIPERFGDWIPHIDGLPGFTIEDPELGPSNEQPLLLSRWGAFQRHNLRGESLVGRPNEVAIGTDDRLYFDPIPDRRYIVRGLYRKAPQQLEADDDRPDMPAQYHKAIRWRALILLGIFDEATAQFPAWQSEYNTVIEQMTRRFLPDVTMPSPLA